MQEKDRYQSRVGFTLIELLIFLGIFTLIIGSFLAILVSTVGLQTKQLGISEVEQQGQFLTQQLQYYIQGARLVDMPLDLTTSTLELREATSTVDPTVFFLGSDGIVYMAQGSSTQILGTSTAVALTSNKVIVSNFSFTYHFNLNSTSSAIGTDSVSYSFTVTSVNGAANQVSQDFQSSVAVLAPIPKIALVQQGQYQGLNYGGYNFVVPFSTPVQAGDLLVGVVVVNEPIDAFYLNNIFTEVASATYPGTSENIAVFVQANAEAGSEEATLDLLDPGTGTIYLYEYRGASLANAFDTWTGQTQAVTSTPTSGSVDPTPGDELLLGVNYNPSSNEVPSPGAGFTLETSSTVVSSTPNVYVEDENEYVSGPVSAPWVYTGTPSTTSMIVTIK